MRLIGFPFLIFLGLALCLLNCSSDSECKQDSDCPAGRYCQAGKCAYDCTHDSDCPLGYRCTLRGSCERGCVKTNDGVELCDEQDNDCDDLTDEDFVDLGLPCDLGCGAGVYVCSDSGEQAVCNGPAPAPDDSTCNGQDDDCDDLTDEDAADQDCPLQEGVCSGTTITCQVGGGYSQCDYGPLYSSVDDSCDQVDNNCDGLTDEDAQGSSVPEIGEFASDGLDNNCNGLVDERGGVMIIISDSLAIDAYETAAFENFDCTGTQYGVSTNNYPSGFPAQGEFTTTLYACSLPGIYPSGYLSWYRAGQLCTAQGKRLCTASEYREACAGELNYAYPYGQYWAPGVCNDGWLGDRFLAHNGDYDQCVSSFGAYDMSGNLAEWVLDQGSLGAGTRLVGGGSYSCQICNGGDYCQLCNHDQHEFEFDKINNCFPDANSDRWYECFGEDDVKPYLGTRCCLDL